MRLAVVLGTLATLVACSSSGVTKSPVGASCLPQADGTSTQCTTNLCIALDTGTGVCSSSCATSHTCPSGFTCEEAGKFGLVCLKADGCKVDADCPAGHVCDPASSTCYIKVDRQLCDPCDADPQCPSGGTCFTAQGSGERFCTEPCTNSTCPAGYACETLPGVDGGGQQCLPLSESCNYGKGLCAACKGDNECGTFEDLCVRNVVSGEQFCGSQCDPTRSETCPIGFTCTDLKLDTAGTGPFQCVPNSNTCVGYCDSTDEHTQVLQCGLGHTCDVGTLECQPASDGRQCSPCATNDDCAKPDNPGNECIVNNAPNSPYNTETFCAEPCPADGGQGQCLTDLGPGFSCATIGNQGFCVPDRGTCSGGLGQLGDNCAANGANDCVTGVCLVAGAGSICSAQCSTDAECGNTRYACCNLNSSQLADGGTVLTYDCSQRNSAGTGPASGTGVCSPAGGAFGDDCSPGRPPCSTGACLDLGTDELCTELCPDGICPANFTCEAATDPTDDAGATQMVCFPQGGGVVGSNCTFGPAACAGHLCIKKDSGNVCTKTCTGPSDCASGYSCSSSEMVIGETGKQSVCIPDSLE